MRMGQRALGATMNKGLSDGQSLPDNRGRKVRSPQGSVPANGRGGVWRRALDGKCHRKYTARATG
jgi:hypothetical protein